MVTSAQQQVECVADTKCGVRAAAIQDVREPLPGGVSDTARSLSLMTAFSSLPVSTSAVACATSRSPDRIDQLDERVKPARVVEPLTGARSTVESWRKSQAHLQACCDGAGWRWCPEAC